MRIHLLLAVSLVVSSGCQATLPTGAKKAPIASRPATSGADVERLVSQSGIATEFSGRARLISDNGLGIISNNAGGLISDNGLGLIANNGAGLRAGYGVLADGQRQESLLADATIEVLDAEGRVLVDSAKKAITATTDKQGAYRFKAVLPAENLVLRIKLWNGGVLQGLLAYDKAGGARTLDLDTASTLGAHYVLDKFVKKRKAVLDRLPRAEAEGLQKDMEAARQFLPAQAPSYKPADMLVQAEALRKKDATLNARLDQIEAILLVGQAELGTGLAATRVSLGFPTAIVGDAKGQLYIAEAGSGRIRRVNADGTVAVAVSQGIGIPRNMIMAPDGDLIVADMFANLVKRVTPDGKMTILAGTGAETQASIGGAADKASVIRPQALAYGPDGTLYIAELHRDEKYVCRILALGNDGILRQLDTSGFERAKTFYTGVAVAQDGTIYAVDGRHGRVGKRDPQGTWTVLAEGLKLSDYSMAIVRRDGRLIVAETDAHRLVAIDAMGKLTVVAGAGKAGYSGDGGPATQAELNAPAGMWEAPDGTLYVADAGNSMVRAIGTDGVIRTVAGVSGVLSEGDALTIAVNSPSAITLDPQGRLVISETSGDTIKRLDNGQLSVIAGNGKGFGGDGGPAKDAQINAPTGVAYSGDTLYVLDTANHRVRRVDPQGVITTVAGASERKALKEPTAPALSSVTRRPVAIAIAPDGQPIWADNDSHQILKLRKDDTVELVAGALGGKEGDKGDNGPAVGAQLKYPVGVVYDAKGNLFVADSGNMRIRKITPDGQISTFAGLAAEATLGKLLLGKLPNDEGVQATGATMLGPVALCFDQQGNMYVAEAGTEMLSSVGGLADLGPLTGLASGLPKVGARIRKITPAGVITTIAGQGSKVLADATGDNSLNRPAAILIDREGRLVICDGGNNQIKMLPKGTF